METKNQLRKEIKQKMSLLSDVEKAVRACDLFAMIEQAPRFIAASSVFIFWSLPDEINTHDFIKKWQGRKRFYLPVMVGDDLVLRLYSGDGDLKEEEQFGVLQPTGAALEDESIIKLAIIPGVAFGANNERLGRGRGFYDRVLPRLTIAWKIGVGFREQLVDQIPLEDHDFLLDEIIVA